MLFRIYDACTLTDAITSLSTSEDNILIFDSNCKIEVDKELPVVFSKTSVKMEGNGAIVKGYGVETGLVIEGENVLIEGLTIKNFLTGIFIRSSEKDTTNIQITGCDFHQINNACIMTGIINSNHTINNVVVSQNLFEAPSAIEGTHGAGHVACATCFFNALYDSPDHPIHDAVLKNIVWKNNKTIANEIDQSQFSEGLMAHGACNYAFFKGTDMFESSYNEVYNCLFENLIIEGNEITGVHDIGMTLLASFPGKHDNVLQNVVIRNNKITYFNTGINVGATNQCCSGSVSRMYAKNILIEKNVLLPQEPGPFEPQIGIMLFTTRCESQEQICVDCHMEGVVVKNNDISGREVGIQVEAQHGTQELPFPSRISRCTIRDLIIEENTIRGAQHAIKLSAVHMEGRVDDFWGYRVPIYDETKGFSTLAEDNSINRVHIKNNSIIEYEIALVVYAAWGCNNTLSKNNTIGPDVSIVGNKLNGGRKVFCYNKYIANQIFYDDAMGFGNTTLGKWDI